MGDLSASLAGPEPTKGNQMNFKNGDKVQVRDLRDNQIAFRGTFLRSYVGMAGFPPKAKNFAVVTDRDLGSDYTVPVGCVEPDEGREPSDADRWAKIIGDTPDEADLYAQWAVEGFL